MNIDERKQTAAGERAQRLRASPALTEHLEALVLGTWCPLLTLKSTVHMWYIYTMLAKQSET